MAFRLLLFSLTLSLLPLTLAQPSPSPHPSAFDPPRVVILKDGLETQSVSYFYDLSSALPPNTEDLITALSIRHSFSEGSHIATASVDRVEYAGDDNLTVIIYIDLTFNSLPGLATLITSLTEPQKLPWQFSTTFHVVGVALHTGAGDKLRIHSGKSAPPLFLPAPKDDNRILTVNATVYASEDVQGPDNEALDKAQISFGVEAAQGENPLPWDRGVCKVDNDPNMLDNDCAMAFSHDYSSFSMRVPDGKRLEEPLKLVFYWTGLKDFADAAQGGEGGVWGGSSPDPLQDDQITIARVDQTARHDNAGDGGVPPWKITVIVVTVILLVNAAVTLVCCCICGRKNKSPKKPRPFVRSVEHRIHQLGLQRVRFGSREDEDKCFVEEPSSQGGSTILMLENEPGRMGGGGVAAGLVPPETTPSKELSAARLVLPREVTRGVDLEPSTEGGSMRFPLSGDDVTSYGRGMTSVPKDLYRNAESDTDEDGHGPQARSAGDLGILTTVVHSTEERVGPAEPEEAVGRSGVGAAINRVRQVDLLNGPHSKGLVGRNGDPIRQPGPADGSAKVLSLSTVS